ncbi:MAG: hypothetical protein ACOYOE_10135 [Chlorobium sp.]
MRNKNQNCWLFSLIGDAVMQLPPLLAVFTGKSLALSDHLLDECESSGKRFASAGRAFFPEDRTFGVSFSEKHWLQGFSFSLRQQLFFEKK